MRRLGIATAAVAALEIASPLGLVPAGASTSGYVYTLTTGPYYPGWYADNCLKAAVASDDSNQAYDYSSVDPGRCGGTGADMQSGWIGLDAQGYKNGSFCGETGWYYSPGTVDTFGVGARECSGSGNYRTNALGQWWDYVNDVWQYTSPENLSSPYQTVT